MSCWGFSTVSSVTNQLSAPTGISIGPGETAKRCIPTMPSTRCRARTPRSSSMFMWPLQDFTAVNGATRIVPGATGGPTSAGTADRDHHRRDSRGNALIYTGSVWHGGGANLSDANRLGVVLHYAVSWLRPVENHVLVVPPAAAVGLPERLQELLGYNIHPAFIGYVDGRHPAS